MTPQRTKAKLARVRSMGGRVTTVPEFLALTKEDRAHIEMRLALSDKIRKTRKALGWNQTQLAQRMGSDQSRIAKAEKADPSVSFDLLIRTLLALQLEPRDIAATLMTIGALSGNGNGKAKPAASKRAAKRG